MLNQSRVTVTFHHMAPHIFSCSEKRVHPSPREIWDVKAHRKVRDTLTLTIVILAKTGGKIVAAGHETTASLKLGAQPGVGRHFRAQ